jgi:hypothetical protein
MNGRPELPAISDIIKTSRGLVDRRTGELIAVSNHLDALNRPERKKGAVYWLDRAASESGFPSTGRPRPKGIMPSYRGKSGAARIAALIFLAFLAGVAIFAIVNGTVEHRENVEHQQPADNSWFYEEYWSNY